jgi:ABC-type dipeptide/oligopeptide/nickel transport system ATPase subunit
VDFHTENTLIEHAQQVRRNWERRGILLMQNSEAEKTELKMLIERNVEVVNRVRLVTQSPYAPLERTQEIMELWREQWDVRTRMLEQMLWMEEVMEVMGVGNGSCG